MANDKNFKVKNGLLASRYYGSAGTETAGSNGPYGTFDTTTYTGNGSTQTITNNIDLSTDGGLVWIKVRDYALSHYLFDTERGISTQLKSNSTDFQSTISGKFVTSFNTDGFTVDDDTDGSYGVNGSSGTYGNDYVSWTFKQAAGFFDVVTYTGNGTTGRTVSHNLGTTVGTIIIKQLNDATDWIVYHRSLGATKNLRLNNTDVVRTESGKFNDTEPTSTDFTLGNESEINGSGNTYVAYLFAHETSDDGYIQCDSYTGDGSTDGPEIDLGWQPSWIMIKRASGGTGGWFIFDTQRGIVTSGNDATLQAESSAAEGTGDDRIELTDSGFKIVTTSSFFNNTGDTYIYMAIRAVVQTTTLDLSTGHTFTITPTEATDVLFTNPPASGIATGFTVEVDNSAGGYALTWPSSIKWDLGAAPTATASKELYTFITTDGGTTYYGKKAAGDIA
jgi:hypothetical protein